MNDSELEQLRNKLISITQSAGRAILPIAAQIVNDPSLVKIKGDGSPLTMADLASNDIIVAELEKLTPEIKIISEEGDLKSIESTTEAWPLYWLIDPLDGTKEFIKGYPDYTVNVALIENGRPILGVVGAPATDIIYSAARNQGAFLQVGNSNPQAIKARIQDSNWVAVVSRSHLNQATEAVLQKLGIVDSTPHGSSIKMCSVAEGQADIYPRIGPTMLWDTAAGAAVAREAGCLVWNLSGDDLSYHPADGLKHSGFFVFPRDNQVLKDKITQIL
ncbi:MAG: 3'(2'),5'-bisphosphate nucleotidase CysQ [Deltaproteobacteria bacterium]|nr:3'(2'),5'-bisphosphate nucleotidase CysQ [Deltaproteobacteria bacterium]